MSYDLRDPAQQYYYLPPNLADNYHHAPPYQQLSRTHSIMLPPDDELARSNSSIGSSASSSRRRRAVYVARQKSMLNMPVNAPPQELIVQAPPQIVPAQLSDANAAQLLAMANHNEMQLQQQQQVYLQNGLIPQAAALLNDSNLQVQPPHLPHQQFLPMASVPQPPPQPNMALVTPIVQQQPMPPATIELAELSSAYGFCPTKFLSLDQLPQLPPVSICCYKPSSIAPGITTHKQVQLPTEERVIELNDEDVQTIVRENANYTKFDKTIVTTVNRRHTHTQRVINNENVYNTYVTNNLIKVNDIHRNRVENVKGETKVKNDAKQTVVVEPAKCVMVDDDGGVSMVRGCAGEAVADESGAELVNDHHVQFAIDQQQLQQNAENQVE